MKWEVEFTEVWMPQWPNELCVHMTEADSALDAVGEVFEMYSDADCEVRLERVFRIEGDRRIQVTPNPGFEPKGKK